MTRQQVETMIDAIGRRYARQAAAVSDTAGPGGSPHEPGVEEVTLDQLVAGLPFGAGEEYGVVLKPRGGE